MGTNIPHSIRTRPTVALARSAAALGGLREVAEILIPSDGIRGGKAGQIRG